MIIIGKARLAPLRRRMSGFCLGTSIAALAVALAAPAAAQCVTGSGGSDVLCSGAVPGGLTIDTAQQRVTIAAGARISGGSDAALLNAAASTQITVDGAVDGGSRPGLLIRGGDVRYVPYDPYGGAAVPVWPYPAPGTLVPVYTSSSTSLTVSAGGAISGSTGVLVGTSDPRGSAYASVTNAGSITATSGPALQATGNGYFTSIVNETTGAIGGIAGPLYSVTNMGAIDGGNGAAIAVSGSSGFSFDNRGGTIRSSGTAATISGGSIYSGSNSGEIRNAGTGAAIDSSGYLYLTNLAGGVVSSGGAIAIRGAGMFQLENRGTIIGSVVSTGSAASSVNTLLGVIQGDLRLGSGDDFFAGHFNASSGRIDSVTGAIDLGGGKNTVRLGVDGDATLSSGVLPANVSTLGLVVSKGAAVTLGADFTGLESVSAQGSGRLINDAALASNAFNSGPLLLVYASGGTDHLDVENRASIVTTGSYSTAVAIGGGSFVNRGVVSGVGTGAIVDNYPASDGSIASLTNLGTITGGGLGARVSTADLINSGTITAVTGTGAMLDGSSRYLNPPGSLNNGSITGGTTGVSASSALLRNGGTISGGTTGIVADGSILDNLATGTISGAIGIDARNGYNVVVRNAGVINGTVQFGQQSYYRGGNVYVDAGGTLNGALLFGAGDDLLVVRLDAAAARPLAGATGGIQMGGGDDTIRYLVDTNANAAAVPVAGFSRLAYEVRNGAKLVLRADNIATPIGLVGTGLVDLDAGISTSARAGLDLTGATVDAWLSQPGGSATGSNAGLTVISRGEITATNLGYDPSLPFGQNSSCAVLGGDAAFENAGSITASARPGSFGGTAICGGGIVTNSGTIVLNGTSAVTAAKTVINSGTIFGTSGAFSYGVGAVNLVNTGQIVVSGTAFSGDYNQAVTVKNSGRLESGSGLAVNLASGGTLINEKTGVIKGADIAISGSSGTLTNRGSIVGTIELGSYWSNAPSRYVADGGTVTGDVRFGSADDIFVQTAARTGVSGIIDGGSGTDTVVLAGNGSATFDGAVNFEALLVQSGSWTLSTVANFRDGTAIATGATLIGTTNTLLGGFRADGTVQIAQNFDGSFLGSLTGGGTLAKSGSGTVALSAQPGFTGTVQLLGGGLTFDGNATFSLSVSNGTFTGSGQIGALTVGRGGIVSPGGGGGFAVAQAQPRAVATPAGIGTLAVTGAFQQGAGSTYLATVTAGGQSDRIVVGGAASIDSAARLQLAGTRAGIGTRYVLLTAAGGISGTYGIVDQSAGDTEVRLLYTANSLFGDVVRSRTGLANVAATGNQRAVAAGLGSLGIRNAAYTALTTIAEDSATRVGLDLLSGQVHASLRAGRVQEAQLVQDALRGHLQEPLAATGIWGSYLSGSGTNDGSADAAQTQRSTLGGVGGVERLLGAVRLGVGGGYTRTKLAMGSLASNARASTVHVFGTVGAAAGPIGVSAGIGYGWTRNRTERQIAFATFNDMARARYDTTLLHGFVEAEHRVQVGGGTVAPFAGVESYRIHADALAETGGAAALQGAARSQSFTFARAGIRLETPIVATLSAHASAAWLRRIHGEAPAVSLQFGGGDAFGVSGTPLSRDSARAELGLRWTPVERMRVSAGYVGTIGSRSDDNGLRVGANLNF